MAFFLVSLQEVSFESWSSDWDVTSLSDFQMAPWLPGHQTRDAEGPTRSPIPHPITSKIRGKLTKAQDREEEVRLAAWPNVCAQFLGRKPTYQSTAPSQVPQHTQWFLGSGVNRAPVRNRLFALKAFPLGQVRTSSELASAKMAGKITGGNQEL